MLWSLSLVLYWLHKLLLTIIYNFLRCESNLTTNIFSTSPFCLSVGPYVTTLSPHNVYHRSFSHTLFSMYVLKQNIPTSLWDSFKEMVASPFIHISSIGWAHLNPQPSPPPHRLNIFLGRLINFLTKWIHISQHKPAVLCRTQGFP